MIESSAEPPRDALYRMCRGYMVSQALYVVAKLGVADELRDGPRAATEVARRVGAHPRSLFRVMRALASLGVFTQDRSDRFGLTPMGGFLRTDHPDSIRHTLILFGEEPYRAAGSLLGSVRTGEPAFDRIFGRPRFDYLGEHPEASATFNAAMVEFARRSRPSFGPVDFAGRRTVVDVGGGRGEVLASILEANPHLRGILFDLPQGVAEARTLLESRGVADRCRIVTGSMFESVPSGGDVYVLSQILHDWPDSKAAAILANVRKVIPDDGLVLLREAVLPEGDAPSRIKMTDLNMLVMLGGAERTEAEWQALLGGTGFALARVHGAGGGSEVIEARPV